MTRNALALAAAALLLLPAGAAAKQVAKVELCGQDGCYTWDRANSGGKLVLFDTAGRAPVPPPAAAPWYRMRVTIAGDMVKPFTFTNAYVPSADSIRQRSQHGGHEWVEVIDDLKPVLRNEAARLQPFPAASLDGAEARPQPPAARPEPPAAPDGGMPWAWIVLAAGAAAALALGFRRRASLG